MTEQDAQQRPERHLISTPLEERMWAYIEDLEQHQKECPCLYLGAQTKTIEQQADRIKELESIERNLRESCEILKALEQQANTRIAELEEPDGSQCDTCDEYSDACVCVCAVEEREGAPAEEPEKEGGA